ncbi:SET domain-containing protein 5 [Gnomoniopsis smithogilvyi]|uniref:SET domain-containing protein 5 n=1 Tax=Gnomoniopsis smithogilvyi TaxID=1191159 RepID=A0A9W8Z3X9_9PEZI|nr:SET domain-containing protein 5 [Gnomoniopsis smithogilvyi]
MPVFADHAHLKPLDGDVASPYRDVNIPGKGVGLVATRVVEPNEVYMARTPAVMLDDTAFRLLGRARLTALLTKAVDDLPYAHRMEYLNLTTHSEVESHAERVYEIFMKNNFRTEVQNVEVFHSAFTQVSRLNHACRPNSDYFFDDATLSHNIFAARKVDTGEELTVTYSDPVQTHMSRQMYLLRHWGFECTCSLCTASETEIEESDTRIDEIRSLWADLDNYTPDSAATPEKAERLIDLYHDEDLVTRMVEAYYRVAVEWNGVGDSEKAKMFAEKAITAGKIMESGIRPFLNNMRELARNPESHWTWRFRVRNSA